ncbi:hypothetical protein MEQU1_002245 [Malassezia equina]|uniref:Uncharacterized protein n=1 Tax=Malassezia equina TaxID=1381935 RepID=A0AAF0EK42_9BASI|nr:hypothetical protein MEQU1_002245 [Malassezia equina]
MSEAGDVPMRASKDAVPVSVVDTGMAEENSSVLLSQRYQFRPYDTLDAPTGSDEELPSPASQPFLTPRERATRDYERVGLAGLIPFLVLYIVHWAMRRWKTIVTVATFGAILGLMVLNVGRPEWHEMAYYRVDPNVRVPLDASGRPISMRPLHPILPPKLDQCPGPNGVPVPLSPSNAHPTPASHPKPIVGDYKLVGVNGDQCITYEERYGMYTDKALKITYRLPEELLPATEESVDEDPDNPWPMRQVKGTAPRGTVNYDPLYGIPKPEHMPTDKYEDLLRERLMHQNTRDPRRVSVPNWREIMDACYARHVQRQGWNASTWDGNQHRTNPAVKRMAIVMRAYEGYPWREDDILNLRAMISELSLNNPNTPYDVRILVEVKDRALSVFTSEWDRYRVLVSSVPREFWGLVEFWSEKQLEVLYAGLPGRFINNMIAQTSYRACLMALQKFWLDHQEYDYVYNWEMDVRYIGNYLDFFEGIENYARQEPLNPGMHKYETWYMPGVPESERIWRAPTNSSTKVGEEADMITLGPIFDPRGSGWYWTHDVQNYPRGKDTDRRASIGTNMRLSRGLLEAMNVVNAEAKKSLHCEAWPTTLVLHSQMPLSHDHSFYPEAGFSYTLPIPFKGVFAPHPIYFRHEWDIHELNRLLNRQDFYEKKNENLHKDSSFYYHAQHAKELYMGWKKNADVCRAPSMLHPIKRVD